MRRRHLIQMAVLAAPLAAAGCATHVVPTASPAPVRANVRADHSPIAGAMQLVLVTTPAWDSTSGTLRQYERDRPGQPWRAVGAAIPIVLGQTGLAWDDAIGVAAPGEPVKREGDGKSPAGAFALDTAFGFSDRESLSWVRLPYLQLQRSTECVDDSRSAHYNTIVDRTRVSAVDWTSSERMRAIDQYTFGVHVAYNAAPPRAGRGSCIFLHVWAGPTSVTAGCTAMESTALQELMRWLAPDRRPMIAQLPSGVLARVRASWALP
ncbi:MAG TPA: L,D-transpeptidase family protein [Gemmatimonadaceae bacterium]|nr:L,D-transpeptidase family protein [Gemmatimonadaceae bacterium]